MNVSHQDQNSEDSARVPARPTHRPWVAVLLSFLLPGVGQFLTGRKVRGLKWFLGLSVLNLIVLWSFASPLLPGVAVALIFGFILIVCWVAMLVDSWQRMPRLGVVKWLLVLLATATFSFLVPAMVHPLVHPFRVPTGAMEPTIRGARRLPDGSTVGGDLIVAERYAYWFSEPKRGDIIVFENHGFTEALPRTFYVKRVIGLPGDLLSMREGRLLNHGSPVEAPAVLARMRIVNISTAVQKYLRANGEAYQVPERSCFVIGDNTANSSDSRYWGPVPREAVRGRVSKVYWPWNRAGNLDQP